MKISSMQDLEQALTPYYAISAKNTGEDITVERTDKLMRHLGNPEEAYPIIHIAGTSGKTSTTYYTAALLHATGQKIGYTVSPHVDSMCERVQILGAEFGEAEFLDYMGEFLEIIDNIPNKPSWFELLVGFAFWVFAKQNVDYAVVETGLGGLHDSTNVAKASSKICVITDIGIDHQRILGDNVASIAQQKAGIIHESNVTLMYEQDRDIMQMIEQKIAQTEGSKLFVHKEQDLEQAYSGQFLPDLPDFQHRNWLLSYAAYRHLVERDLLQPASAQELLQTQSIVVPARMEKRRVNDSTTVIMDGAHNEAKMRAFVESFASEYPDKRVPILLALKKDKHPEHIAPILKRIASKVIVTSFSVSQDWPIESQNPTELATLLKDSGLDNISAINDPVEAFNSLLSSHNATVIVTGSFYLISQLRKSGLVKIIL